MLDEILARLDKLTPEQLKDLEREVNESVPDLLWYPHPENKPQCEAYYSKADVLLFGGNPGGGKTALGIGLGLTEHRRTLIVRKQFTDLEGVVDNLEGMIGTSKGITRGNRPRYKSDNRLIYFQGMQSTGEIDTGKQGTAYDLIYIDEAAQFPEEDIRLLIGWNRRGAGVPENQRCRIVMGSNPPTSPVGDWLGTFFAPWFDPKHPNPAKFGELRWFYYDDNGKSIETEHTEPFEIDGKKIYPHSRTYIFSSVDNNPYLDSEEYKKKLQSIPEPFRSQLLSGNFMAARADQENQVIPTAWVQAAFARWEAAKGLPPEGIPMCSLGVDCAGGGKDEAVIIPRYDHFFGRFTKFQTISNEYGSQIAAEVIKVRRDRALVSLDMGGGYGSGAWILLKDNIGGENLYSYKGANTPTKRTKDGNLSYYNLRAQCYWEFREALNPDQDGGSQVALPPDPRLLAGLTAPIFYDPRDHKNKIKIETKEDVCEKLKYSPNEADAVVMAWYSGRKGLIPETTRFNSFNSRIGTTRMPDKYQNRREIL